MDTAIKQALQAAGLVKYFERLAPSHQKEYLVWINEAKKDATRQKRIASMIDMLRAKQ